MWMMLQNSEPEDFIIGTGETHSVREFCEMTFSYLGLDYQDYVIQDPHFYRPAEVDLLVANPRKAREKLNWKPKVTLDELVKMMVNADLERLSKEIV
jgi:GDPmannose 4,6-dehydratase